MMCALCVVTGSCYGADVSFLVWLCHLHRSFSKLSCAMCKALVASTWQPRIDSRNPRFLTAIMTGTLVALAESRVAGLGLIIAELALASPGQMPSFATLVAITVFWSIGFHLYASMAPVITLTLAKGQERRTPPRSHGCCRLGRDIGWVRDGLAHRWTVPALP
jgi:hypothetical protein